LVRKTVKATVDIKAEIEEDILTGEEGLLLGQVLPTGGRNP